MPHIALFHFMSSSLLCSYDHVDGTHTTFHDHVDAGSGGGVGGGWKYYQDMMRKHVAALDEKAGTGGAGWRDEAENGRKKPRRGTGRKLRWRSGDREDSDDGSDNSDRDNDRWRKHSRRDRARRDRDAGSSDEDDVDDTRDRRRRRHRRRSDSTDDSDGDRFSSRSPRRSDDGPRRRRGSSPDSPRGRPRSSHRYPRDGKDRDYRASLSMSSSDDEW